MEIVNRVAESEIEVYNLDGLWEEASVAELDIAPFLVEGLMLRERHFRAEVKEYDWSQHEDEHVAVYCSTDAIIPTWAFMLIATKLKGVARSVAHGRADDLIRDHFVRQIEAEDWSQYEGRIVVVKGCGGQIVPTDAYMLAVQKLQDVAAKLMFGEPCSSVPLWRRPKEKKAPAKAKGVKKPELPGPGK